MTLNRWSRIPTLCPLTLRLTASVVKVLAMADPIPHPVFKDHQALSDSLAWLRRSAQQQDGSFADQSSYRPNKLVVSRMAARAAFFPLSPFLNMFSSSSCQCSYSSTFSDWLQAGDGVEYKVYLTSFVLIAMCKVSEINDRILQLRVRTCLLLLSPPHPAATEAHI